MGKLTMRAVRVECATSSISHDLRIQKALEFVSWDYRGNLGIINGNLRLMVECITLDSQCLPPGFSIGGISVIEVLEEWSSDYLTHHLLILELVMALLEVLRLLVLMEALRCLAVERITLNIYQRRIRKNNFFQAILSV